MLGFFARNRAESCANPPAGGAGEDGAEPAFRGGETIVTTTNCGSAALVAA